MGGKRIILPMVAATLLVVGSAVAQGMATVTIGVNIEGTEVDGVITIKDANGTTVAEGPANSPLSVPTGTYNVSVMNKALIDHPTYVNRGFTFEAGREYKCSKAFSSSTVTLLVTKGGRRVNGDVILQRQGGGEPVAKVRSGTQFKISAGRYQGKFKSGRNEWDISGLQFPEGAIETIPVQF